jgi:A/G-specific adenine glycosylase
MSDRVLGPVEPVDVRSVRNAVLRWAPGAHRDLPWRATRDPWAVLVSELMLQQTQVSRVIPRYHEFLKRFPTVTACAASPLSEVIRAWAGLGYNRRAVNLHRCAELVVTRHGGELPADLEALMALPGIGPYTARAVLAFAFEQDTAVVDTNVGRVLARMAGEPLTPRRAQGLADALVPRGKAWVWNQAMLDLGATVCRARMPTCGECPIRRWCRWGAARTDGRARLAGPDPAVGSASVSGGQSPFMGSDRQGRGRLVAALRARGSVPVANLAAVAGWPGDDVRAQRVAESLVADGLACWSGGSLVLPR